MSAPVKVAVAGAGAWGRNHLRVLHGLGALAGAVEVCEASRERVRQDFPGLPVWGSLAEAFRHGGALDGVVIATPAPTHADLAGEALREGRGVLVEKPMTLEAREAAGLVDQAEGAGRVLMVGHLLLYQPAVRELKRLLDSGILGRVHRIHQERTNLGRVRSTESALWSLAPHDVAVLVHLMGEAPVRVSADGAAFLQPGVHDDVHLELGFTGGRSAHVHVSWYWPGRGRGLRVLGERGMLVYDEEDQSLVLHRKRLHGGDCPRRLETVDDGSVRVFEGPGEALRLEDEHFLHCLATGATPTSDGRSGLDVIRVLERADAQLLGALPPSLKEA
ncbi:Gfo/Idh/MocA family protein [Mesoterricola silvestris]|uniref:Oxidoreductase n=1 Tax=Mesoterricola silvestris TaxID=2927979 RepID=A0AA48GHA9_9BACT|nr:Gfo/Idh/MocA family oxidoreductase [Mesoterricola silvestris]BDU71217.1 oxidoreductase [Mesoterricola silvestris]